MKKTVCVAAVCATLAAAAAISAGAAENRGVAAKTDEEKIAVVKLLDIMNGDNYGNMNFEAPVTRAEFVKMVIAASQYKSGVPTTSVYTLFEDVPYSHWACGYIAAAVRGGLVSGYLDGTFRPENTVTLEEAVTICLRLLGYPNTDFLGAYPDPQLDKYHEIGLSTGVTAVRSQPMTRYECMKLVYNMLCTPTKSGQTYCATFGQPTDAATGTVDYLAIAKAARSAFSLNMNGSIAEKVPYIYDSDTKIYVDGQPGTLADIEDYDAFCFCDKIKTVWCFDSKLFGQVSAVDLPNVTVRSVSPAAVIAGMTNPASAAASKVYTLNAASTAPFADGTLEKDDFVMACLDDNGNIVQVFPLTTALFNRYFDDTSMISEAIGLTLGDPVVVTDPVLMLAVLPYDFSETTVLINDKNAALTDIRAHDVVYYSEPFDTLVVYEKIVLGELEAFLPNRADAASVTVGGKNYGLDGDFIKRKIAADPALAADSYVMLFLGKDGKAADIVTATEELYNAYADEDENTLDAVNATLSDPFVMDTAPLQSHVPFPLDGAVCYLNGKKTSPDAIREYDIVYYSTPFRTVLAFENMVFGELEAVTPSDRVSPTAVTVGGRSYQLETDEVKRAVSNMGDFDTDDYVLLFLGKDGSAAHILPADADIYDQYADKDTDRLGDVTVTLSEPILVTDPARDFAALPIRHDTATIRLDGEDLTKDDIRVNDVLYYSPFANTVLVVRDSKSGIVTGVQPSRQNPASVTLSNGSGAYSLETDEVKYALSDLGSIPAESLVTLYLGRNNTVVGIERAGTEVIGDGEGQITYTEVVNATLKGPFMATAAGKLPSDAKVTANADCYRDGKLTTMSSIMPYDIYYYSKLLDTVWLYNDTATGRIENILPSVASPSSIVISGKTYALESASAKQAVSSLGSFKVGDRVTLLLGKDGAAAAIVKAGTSGSMSVFGIVTACGKGNYTDKDGKSYTEKNVTVYTTSGDTYTYEFDGTFSVGDAVRVDVSESATTISRLVSPKSSSAISALNNALADGNFADNVGIIDLTRTGEYDTIRPERMKGIHLKAADVLYYTVNASGALEVLILDDYTGDVATYGLVVDVDKENSSKNITVRYILDDEVQKVTIANNIYPVSYGAATFVLTRDGAVQTVNMLDTSIAFAVERLTENEAYNKNNRVFPLADGVKVFLQNGLDYKSVEVKDVIGKGYALTAYYDKDVSDGGRVRVIVAR